MLNNKTILVTGGTGSFGNTVVRDIMKNHHPKEIIIFSRDEKKQHTMRLVLENPELRFIIGDVRDRESIFDAMKGVDYVFHAAALKHVPTCEFFPLEGVKTNVLGTNNVLDAAEYHRVEKVIALSTDKAAYPINALGLSKGLMEKLIVARGRANKSDTTFCVVRYGNVMYSRGSVIPIFVDQIKHAKPLTVTNLFMTRFLQPLPQTVELVLFALESGLNGDMLVRKAHAATVGDLAQACLNVFNSKNGIDNIGIREGEKMHETLLTQEESIKAIDKGKFFQIKCDKDMNYDEYFIKGKHRDLKEGYTSENAKRLSIPEIEELLLSIPEIRKEVPWIELQSV